MKTIISPCIHVCKIGPHRRCLGCKRTAKEITNWSNFEDYQREGIMDRLKYWENPENGYSEEYDAYYDKATGEWIEGQCSDPDCEYCKDRPPRATKPKHCPAPQECYLNAGCCYGCEDAEV